MRTIIIFTFFYVFVETECAEGTFWFKNGKIRDELLLNSDWTFKATDNRAGTIHLDYIVQKLDHFNPTDKRVWAQRYFVNSAFYKPGGPIFLYLNGEGIMHYSTISDGSGYDWIVNARLFGALRFLLEHRYYGGSRPTSDASTRNLKWLSSEQALADTAYFIEFMNRLYDLVEPKWVLFGGSYAGNLVAWFRLKYPHLAIGAVASSAPVEAKINFWEYLQVVRNSLASYSEECVRNIHSATEIIEERIRNLCGNSNFSNPLDLRVFFADLFFNFAGVVQYSEVNAVSFCVSLFINEARPYGIPVPWADLNNFYR
ncbi:unnamed protein product [Soboliphyme baturini]|uniref:Serine protease K12H4.7 n=1 Tax=Soboliphyme baturini TaxID=241478 RepID=A0A183IIL0_9BILA|nr:unnamed protein product [Soboliphyme baturini]